MNDFWCVVLPTIVCLITGKDKKINDNEINCLIDSDSEGQENFVVNFITCVRKNNIHHQHTLNRWNIHQSMSMPSPDN